MRVLLPLLLITGCGLPALSSEDIYGLEPLPRAWVYGTVVQPGGGAVSGATVQLATESLVTTDSGAFRIEAAKLGPIELVVSRAGFETMILPLQLRAGGNPVQVALVSLSCGVCSADDVCDPQQRMCVQGASISGDIVDACTGAAVAARITVSGNSTCSVKLKGIWLLRGLTPGGPQTLAVGREGYRPFSTPLTLTSGFNALDKVSLMPIGGCGNGTPAGADCTCTSTTCQ